MNSPLRRPVLLSLLALGVLALGWWFFQTADEPKPSARPARSDVVTKPGAARPVGAPRSANGLIPSAQEDISVDSLAVYALLPEELGAGSIPFEVLHPEKKTCRIRKKIPISFTKIR